MIVRNGCMLMSMDKEGEEEARREAEVYFSLEVLKDVVDKTPELTHLGHLLWLVERGLDGYYKKD